MANPKTRNFTIDLMRGIAILAVFVGHFAIFPPLHLQRLAFSFHMPLLVMIGGLFFKPQDFRVQVYKDILRLWLPYVVTLLLSSLLSIRNGEGLGLLYGIYGSVVKPTSTMLQGDVPCVGILWFLPAIFWCRTFYNILTKLNFGRIVYTLVIFVISIGAIYGSGYLILPFGISHGLSMLIFYHIGANIKDVLNLPFKAVCFVVALASWGLSFVFARLSIGEFYYEMLLLNIVGTTGAFYCIYWLSKLLLKHRFIYPLLWCGQNSMALYCFHALCFYVIYIVSGQYGEWTPYDPHLVFVTHLVFCIGLTYVSARLSWIKYIYGIVDFKYEKNSIC